MLDVLKIKDQLTELTMASSGYAGSSTTDRTVNKVGILEISFN